MAGIWHWRYSPAIAPQGAGGATEIVPASALQGHQAASAPVGQAHILSAAGAAHVHQADLVSLAQSSNIVIGSALHGLTSDAPALLQSHASWPQDSAHALLSPGAGVAGALLAVPADRLYQPRGHGRLRPAADERLIITEKHHGETCP